MLLKSNSLWPEKQHQSVQIDFPFFSSYFWGLVFLLMQWKNKRTKSIGNNSRVLILLQLNSIMKATLNVFKEPSRWERKNTHSRIHCVCHKTDHWLYKSTSSSHAYLISFRTILKHKASEMKMQSSLHSNRKKKITTTSCCIALDLLDSQQCFKNIIIDNKCSPFEITLWICYQTLESIKAKEKSHCSSVYCTWMDCSSVHTLLKSEWMARW